MNAKSSLPGDRPDPNLPKGEFFTLAGIAAALGLGGGATKALYEKLKTDDPLLVQVLDSTASDGNHEVQLKIMNLTLHGIYLDEVKVEKPKDATLTIATISEGSKTASGTFDEVTPKPKAITLPFRLSPESTISMKIRIPLGADKSKPHCTLEINYDKLDENKQKTLKQDVLLRWK